MCFDIWGLNQNNKPASICWGWQGKVDTFVLGFQIDGSWPAVRWWFFGQNRGRQKRKKDIRQGEKEMLRWSALIKSSESQHLWCDMWQIDHITLRKIKWSLYNPSFCSGSCSIVSFSFYIYIILQVYPPYLSPFYIYLYRTSVSLMEVTCLSTVEHRLKGKLQRAVSWFIGFKFLFTFYVYCLI